MFAALDSANIVDVNYTTSELTSPKTQYVVDINFVTVLHDFFKPRVNYWVKKERQKALKTTMVSPI